MLTVKTVSEDNTLTITALANQVFCDYAEPPNGAVPAVSFPQKLSYERSDGVHCSFDSGTVFVMNDAGKTVDTYHLYAKKADKHPA